MTASGVSQLSSTVEPGAVTRPGSAGLPDRRSGPADQHRRSLRTTSRIIGILYLAGMVVGISGNLVIQSILNGPDPLPAVAAQSMLLAVCVVFWLATVVGDAAHGVLMFPILKRGSERSAVGYLAARIMDAAFIAVMALLILIQIPLAREYLAVGATDNSALAALGAALTEAHLYAYEFGMAAVGVAGLILCSAFLRTRLIPRPLAIWGLVGYVVLLIGSVLEIVGFELFSLNAGPGGLWEVFIGVWLIVKGFDDRAPVPDRLP